MTTTVPSLVRAAGLRMLVEAVVMGSGLLTASSPGMTEL